MSDEQMPYEWSLVPDPAWTALPAFHTADSQPKFVSAAQSDERIRIRYFWEEANDHAWAHVRFGLMAQGPPGNAHGGCVAAVLDETMGLAPWRLRVPVVAANLSIRYRKPTPLYTELIVDGVIDRIEGRKVWATGRVMGPDGTVYAEGEGLFINIGKDRFKALAGKGPAV